MKTCIKCGIEKPYSEFYKHNKMADGHLGRCKECHKSEMKRNRSENIEYYREYDAWRFKNDPKVRERHKRYQSTDGGVEAVYRACKKFRRENPEKVAAHKMVQNAVKLGKISKPDHCSKCGQFMPSRKIHGHHEDYYKPLDVIWLCVYCHMDHHKNIDSARIKT